MNAVVSPLFFPPLSLESHREGSCHLDSSADRQVRSCLLVEKSQYFIVKIDGSKTQLNSVYVVILFKGNFGNKMF